MDSQLQLPLVPPSPIPSPSPFLSLTTELKQAIFSKLPNIDTLISTVLTCSNFYLTFLDAESLIIRSILHNQIGPELLYDAMLVWRSSSLTSFNDNEVMQFLILYKERDLSTTDLFQALKLRDAVTVGGLYDDIVFLSKDFASLALHINIITGLAEPSPLPLSLLESNRIQRVFYRYELFYNIFRDRDETSSDQITSKRLQEIFFAESRGWENEQLRCVREYLVGRLSIRMCSQMLWSRFKQLIHPAFNDVAEHDVEWGNLQMEYHDGYDRWKEHYLSRGLSYLRQLFHTSTYEDRCHLLKPRKGCPKYTLYWGPISEISESPLPMYIRYSKEDLPVCFCLRPATDGDNGPEDAWLWAYATDATNGLTHWYSVHFLQRTLRKRAYVMWDFARLATWGLLDYDWSSLPREKFDDDSDQVCRKAEMWGSFNARRKIWKRGGKRWWSPGDESRVVWPPGAPIEIPEEEPETCRARLREGHLEHQYAELGESSRDTKRIRRR